MRVDSIARTAPTKRQQGRRLHTFLTFALSAPIGAALPAALLPIPFSARKEMQLNLTRSSARTACVRSAKPQPISRVQVGVLRYGGRLGVRCMLNRTLRLLRVQRVVPRAAKVEEVEASSNGATAVSAAHSSANMMAFDELSDIIRCVVRYTAMQACRRSLPTDMVQQRPIDPITLINRNAMYCALVSRGVRRVWSGVAPQQSPNAAAAVAPLCRIRTHPISYVISITWVLLARH